ncbi:MAG: DUF2235 domain-containing protein [Blastocatellia bacterium]
MPKNIVLLSDGTGNSARKLFKTNIWRVYQALDLAEPNGHKPDNCAQIAYYDDGVGTAAFRPLALLGGAFGWGLKRNVLDLYTFLCRHYKEDDKNKENNDRIYCFGFSRGAFTIRVLTGLINSQGLVQADTETELRRLAAAAFRAYRQERYKRMHLYTLRPLRNGFIRSWNWFRGKKSYNRADNRQPPIITFLGLWDTVAAYGLPIDELTQALDFIFPLSFPDRNLSDIVDRACHAVALDDERHSFHPELWNECKEDYKTRSLDKRLTQVWFAGMHSNVGGGYPDDGMSTVPLNWMMNEAGKKGLAFRKDERERIQAATDSHGKMYDSRKGVGGFYRYMPRKVNNLTHDDVDNEKNRVVIDLPLIHESVFQRINNCVDGYAPIGLPNEYAVVTAEDKIAKHADLLEDPTWTETRAKRQEKVWNLVWWKRVVYFFSLAVFGLLAALPFYSAATLDWETRFRFLSPIIDAASKPLPDLLSFWIEAFQSHPGLFLLIALLWIALIYVGSRLQRKIFDDMRIIWKPSLRQPEPAKKEVAKITEIPYC